MTRGAILPCLLALAAATLASYSRAAECVDFRWDVSQERALFAGSPTQLTGGGDAKSAPTIQLNRLYEIKLRTQDQVTFAVTPAKKNPPADSRAGIVTFKLPAGGSYRVSIDMPFWVDVVQDGAAVAANDFQGQHGCGAPHKIVVFFGSALDRR